jgi:hypothetical protein
MDDISFTTFLKISLMPTTQGKFGALHRMLNGPGGYDFYKRMKLAAREVARGEVSSQEILSQLETIKRPSERSHNLLMATRFVEWLDSLEGAVASLDRPSGTYKRPSMVFGIRVVPELVYTLAGTRYVTYLWAIGLPKLTRQAAGAGLYLLRQQLGTGKFKDARFQIRDLRQQKTLEEDCVTNQSPNLLEADIALLNTMWQGNMPKAA